MTLQADVTGQPTAASQSWYARSPAEVTAALGVDPSVGLSTLGFDKESPGLMARRPRPRGESVLVPPVALLLLWELGKYVARRRRHGAEQT